MYDLRGCRACLNQNCKLERISDTIRRLYCTVTGLDFTPGDSYPCYFCTECSTQIRKILAFRRRCRRAYFVLKEIVSIRQTVTLADLSIVDRKKTNLKSSLDYWDSKNTGFYSVNKVEETETKPSDIRDFFKEFVPTNQSDIQPNISVDTKKYSPEVINNACIAVDIKPDNCLIEDEVIGQLESPDDAHMDIDDDPEGNKAADENVTDIDLEDVFKGLPEGKSDEDSDYGLSDLPEPEEKKKVHRKSKRNNNIDHEFKNASRNVWGLNLAKIDKLSRILLDFDVQLLSFEEQVDMFEARKKAEPFRSAGFKCAVCLVVFAAMVDLYAHVKMHNDKQKRLSQSGQTKYKCTICKEVFGCQGELTCHSAYFHWYKYHCKQCDVDKYTLFDTLTCHRVPEVSVSKYYSMGELYVMSDMTSREPLAPMERNCRFCGIQPKRQKLADHEQIHFEPPRRGARYQCDICELLCRQRSHLESHIYTHYRTFSCKKCDQVFQGWNAAHEHLKQHVKLRCLVCDITFRSERERRNHYFRHRFKSKLDCNLCGVIKNNLSKMYSHQLTQHGYISVNHSSLGDPKYRCGVCDIQFVDNASFEIHKVKRGHEDPDKLKGKCESCQKIFFTVEEFAAHRRGNTVCKRYPVKCVYCAETLRNYHESERHYAQAHPALPDEHQNAMLYTICEYCGKTIAQNYIKNHIKKHTAPSEQPPLACGLCAHRMHTTRAYVSHMLFNHTPKPYLCAQCPFRAKYRSECRDHILKVHAPELLYTCQKCRRRFSHLDLLQEHSVKAHGVSVKEDRSVYLPAKDVIGKIYVFPHMKLDGSFIPPAVLEDTDLYLYDYLCKSHTLVEWKDYYVFDTGVQPIQPDPYDHRKRLPKPWKGEKKKAPKKPISEAVIRAVENQSFNFAVTTECKEKPRQKRKRKAESEFGRDGKIKVAMSDDHVEHEEMPFEYEIPDLQADILGGPSKMDTYVHREKTQKSYSKKRKRKLNETYGDVIIRPFKSESVGSGKVKVADLDETSNDNNSVDNIGHEEIVQSCDMPDLTASILGNPSQGHEVETVEEQNEEETVIEECEKFDMAQVLSENYEVIEKNGEQYVNMNGDLYRLQFE